MSQRVAGDAATWDLTRHQRDGGRGRPLATLRSLRRFVVRKPLGAAGGVMVLLVVLAAVFAPVIATADPYAISGRERLLAPSSEHFFGTDDLGRDVFSRVIHGARVSLKVGLIAVGVSVAAGTVIGLVSGYFGGWLDLVMQRLVDSLMAFPSLVLALTLVAVLGSSITNTMIAIGVAATPGIARVVRGAVISVRTLPYVEAAQVIGAGHARVALRHILPNVAAPIIILATAGLGGAILTEGSLSFLGVGTPQPTPSWGGMLSGSSRTFMERAPWLAVFPGAAITIAVLGFSLLGDAIRDVLDPRLRGT
jgi:peptide/nickel transport system permease protein